MTRETKNLHCLYSMAQKDKVLHGINSEAVILSLQAGGGKVQCNADLSI